MVLPLIASRGNPISFLINLSVPVGVQIYWLKGRIFKLISNLANAGVFLSKFSFNQKPAEVLEKLK